MPICSRTKNAPDDRTARRPRIQAAKARVVLDKADFSPSRVISWKVNAPPGWAAALAGTECFRSDVKAVTFPQSQADFYTLQQLRELPGVEYLSLAGRGVTDERLANLHGMSRLETLLLNQTLVSDRGLEHIRGLTRSCLGIHGGRLTDAALVHLAGLTRLEYLYLTDGGITGAGLVHLRNLDQLLVLDLSKQPLADAGLKNLAGLTTLEELHLDGGRLSGSSLAELRTLTRLRVLNLAGNPLDDAGLADCPHCRI